MRNEPSRIQRFEDIERLVADSVPEGLELEYKSGRPSNKDRFKNDIAQDVSAFANSAGGTLIIGVAEQANGSLTIDGVDSAHFSRESLGQVLAYRISPPIPGLHIACLSSPNGQNVLVASTPASMGAPHQGPNHTYYRRFEHHNQAMAHHEIEDLRRRQISLLPLVVVSTATRGTVLAAIDVRNPGDHPAGDVNFSFSSERIWPENKLPVPMRRGIAHLSPGQRLRFRAQTFGQLFVNPDIPATFEVKVEYTHGRLNQRVSHIWPLDFEAYRESMSVLTDEHQERREALEELRKLREATSQVASCLNDNFPKVAGANGLDLSIYTLRILRNIAAGYSIEKLPANWFTASGFQAALGAPLDVALELEHLFSRQPPVTREAVSAVRGMSQELMDRFDGSFDL